MAFKDNKIKGIISNNTGNGIHSFGAFQYFQYNDPVLIDPATSLPLVVDVATQVGLFSSNDSGSNLTEIVLSPTNISMSAPDATLSNVTVWTANSILTQSRGNALYQANGNYLLGQYAVANTSYGAENFWGMIKNAGQANSQIIAQYAYLSGKIGMAEGGIVGINHSTDPCNIEFRPGDMFNQMRFRSYNQSLLFSADGLSAETGTANWTWSANSILTQGRGDARYQPVGSYLTSANLTWSNITGKPTFATVATSGSYTDLANTPNLSLYYLASNPSGFITASCLTYSNITGTPDLTVYLTTANAAATYLSSANFTYANIGGTIPTATNSTLGAVKVGANLTIANGVLSATSSGGFQNGDTLNGGTY